MQTGESRQRTRGAQPEGALPEIRERSSDTAFRPSAPNTTAPTYAGPGARRYPLKVGAAWPDRFGIASTLVALPCQAGRFCMKIDMELVYTDFRIPSPVGGSSTAAAQALSGAAAFAAGVEATVAIRLRWGDR